MLPLIQDGKRTIFSHGILSAIHPITPAVQSVWMFFTVEYAIMMSQNKTGTGTACRKETTMKKQTRKAHIRKLAAAISLLIIAGVACVLAGCAKQWTCDRCGKTWRGDAYYGSEYSDTLCPDCAGEYWFPLPINNYKK